MVFFDSAYHPKKTAQRHALGRKKKEKKPVKGSHGGN